MSERPELSIVLCAFVKLISLRPSILIYEMGIKIAFASLR